MKKSGLLDYENNWPTSLGIWLPGEGVIVHGKSLFSELKDFSWMKMLVYQITGQEIDEKKLQLLEYYWTMGTSYPDPRIWNNRIAALAATTRSTPGLALGSALAIGEAKIFGKYPGVRIHDFFTRMGRGLDEGRSLGDMIEEEILTHRYIYGYGRPLISGDERIDPFVEKVTELEFHGGRYFQLAFEVEEYLSKREKPLKMNIAALMAAIAVDFNFSNDEFHQIMTPCFTIGLLSCYRDALKKPPLALFPMRCDFIQYQGVFEKKKWKTGPKD